MKLNLFNVVLLAVLALNWHVSNIFSQTNQTTTTNTPAPTPSTKCGITGLAPGPPPYALQFCTMYQDNSCCLSSNDEDIAGGYQTMVDVGLSCPYSKKWKRPELFQYNCMGCDPDQPLYMEDDGITLRVCEDFAAALLGDGANLLKLFDACGLRVVSTNCNLAGSGNDTITLPFTSCGDNVVIPSLAYTVYDSNGNPDKYASWANFMNMNSPPDLGPFGATASPYVFVIEPKVNGNYAKKCFNSGSTLMISIGMILLLISILF